MKKVIINLIFIFLVSCGVVFCLNNELRAEKLEDLSKYGYTLKTKKPQDYSQDLIQKGSPYLQPLPERPSSLEGRFSLPQRSWSSPEELTPPESVMGPGPGLWKGIISPPQAEPPIPPPEVAQEEIWKEEISTERVSPEEIAERLKPIVEEVLGKRPEVVVTEVSAFPVTALVRPPEEVETEELPPQETSPLSGDEWKVIIKEGRMLIRPPAGLKEQDLDRIARYLTELLGRGGEVTIVNLEEGIEIRLP